MSKFEERGVVMLPTKEKAPIAKYNNTLYNTNKNKDYSECIYQHLYVTSDAEPMKGDWVLTDKNVIGKVIKVSNTGIGTEIKILRKDNNLEYYPVDCKKIIATNDGSLTLRSECVCSETEAIYCGRLSDVGKCQQKLPQLHKTFIEHYINEYNKGNVITRVMVEYENSWIPSSSTYGIGEYENKLKVNPKDNTINIKKVKDSWSREEVVELLVNHTINLRNKTNDLDFTKKWIKENLI